MSALNQSYTTLQIFVIDDSIKQSLNYENCKVTVLRTGGGKGVSEARNIGILNTPMNSWIAFLDDDDYWVKQKIEYQVKEMIKLQVDATYTASYIAESNIVRPKKLLNNEGNPIKAIYAFHFGLSRPYFLPFSSLIVTNTISKKVLFDTNLFEREDLHYISEVHKKGFKVMQLPEPTAYTSIDSTRSMKRNTLSSDFMWFKYLFNLSMKTAMLFTIQIFLRNRIWYSVHNLFKLFRNQQTEKR